MKSIILIIMMILFVGLINAQAIVPWYADPNNPGYILPKTGYSINMTTFSALTRSDTVNQVRKCSAAQGAFLSDTNKQALKSDTVNQVRNFGKVYRSIVLSAVGGLGGTTTVQACPNSVSTTYINSVPIRTVGFPYDSTRYLTWQVYMPSNFDSTGGLTYKVYSLSDTLQVDTVYWKLEAISFSDGDTLMPAFGTAVQNIQVNQTATSNVTIRSYQTAESTVLRASGTNKPSCTMIFRLQRTISTNYTRPQLLWYVRISYRINNYSDR
jgi:hypothetical protein